jgi:alpha-glucosidase
MLDVMRFWFERGVDGFRIDVLWHMIKAEGLPDNPANPNYRPGMGEMHKVLQLNSTDQPEVHELCAEMRKLADSHGDRLLVGEIYLPIEKLVTYYGSDLSGVHLPFNFQLVDAPWNARGLGEMIARYEAALPPGGWPNWVLGNHDRPRVAARVGEAQTRVAAMLLLTLRGTPTIYYGDEIGVGDVEIPADRVQDPRELREPGIGLGRDPVRTPMAWDGSPQAGFSSGQPWLPLHVDWPMRNVESERSKPGSMLSLYRALLQLRRTETALSIGEFELLDSEADVLAYRRSHRSKQIMIALNLSSEPRASALPAGEVLLSTIAEGAFNGTLRANEGVILRAGN